MKNLPVLFITALLGLLAVSCTTTPKSAPTMPGPARSGFDSSLPEAFAGITNTSLLPGFLPVAIYQIQSNQAIYACVGTVFQTGSNKFSVLLPEHLFMKTSGPEATYGIRLARPDSGKIDAFVGDIRFTSRSFNGHDIVVANVSASNAVVTNFVTSSRRTKTEIVPKTHVVILGKLVTGLRSLITNKPVRVIGYGFDPLSAMDKSAEELAKTPPMLIIDEPSAPGQSGTPYVDEHRRIFVLNRALVPEVNEAAGDQLDALYFQVSGQHLRGASLLNGPVTFEYRETE